VRGWGSPNSDDWRKSLALCLLCAGVVGIHRKKFKEEIKNGNKGEQVFFYPGSPTGRESLEMQRTQKSATQ
jgi:hypothetical protein